MEHVYWQLCIQLLTQLLHGSKRKLLMVIKHTCIEGRGTNQRKFIVSDQSHTVNIKYMHILTINFFNKCVEK